MKILVFSDSHGDARSLVETVAEEKPELVLHLGDYARDCDKVCRAFPDVPLRAVRGNGDFWSDRPETDEFVVEGRRVFMTHGHLFGVKTGLGAVVAAAEARGADVLLFGHTHVPHREELRGMLVLNPGSAGRGGRTYAVIEVLPGGVESRIERMRG